MQKTIPSIRRGKPPNPPEWLPKECLPEWKSLWKTGIASTWRHGEHEQVARLAYLRFQFQNHGDANVDTLSRLHPQITKLEGSLLLTPESQQRANIVVEDPKPKPKGEAASRRADVQARAAAARAH